MRGQPVNHLITAPEVVKEVVDFHRFGSHESDPQAAHSGVNEQMVSQIHPSDSLPEWCASKARKPKQSLSITETLVHICKCVTEFLVVFDIDKMLDVRRVDSNGGSTRYSIHGPAHRLVEIDIVEAKRAEPNSLSRQVDPLGWRFREPLASKCNGPER